MKNLKPFVYEVKVKSELVTDDSNIDLLFGFISIG